MAWCHFDELGTLHGLLFVASCGFKLFVLLWWYIDSVMPQCTISVFDDDDDVHMHISFFISALSWIFAEVVCVSSSSINDGSFWKWFRVYELTLKPTAFFSISVFYFGICVCAEWRWNRIRVVGHIMSITILRRHLGHAHLLCHPGLPFFPITFTWHFI